MRAAGVTAARELLIFSCDLQATRWYRAQQAPPAPPLQAPWRLQWDLAISPLAEPAVADYTAEATAAERFAAGAQRCTIWAGAQCLYQLWLAVQPSYIEWIDGVVPLQPGHSLILDVQTREDSRGGELHLIGAAAACARSVEIGRSGIIGGIEVQEYPGFARLYAAAGLGLIRPHSRLRKLGDRPELQSCSPGPELLQQEQLLRRRYQDKVEHW